MRVRTRGVQHTMRIRRLYCGSAGNIELPRNGIVLENVIQMVHTLALSLAVTSAILFTSYCMV